MQKTLFITTKGAKRLKKHSNVDYGAAKLIETEKGLIRLVDNCLMKLEPLGKGPRVLQKVFKSELDNLYQKQCLCPWDNNINGQINLRDSASRTINFTNPKNGKFYKLKC